MRGGYSARHSLEGDDELPAKLNKTAVITGASSGLGAEFARQLAARGYDLILTARREDRLRQLHDDLTASFGIGVSTIPADLSEMASIEHIAQAIASTSNIEILINNAGYALLGRFYRVDVAKELAQLKVHTIAPVMFCRAALPGMVSRDVGAIINVASLAGFISVRNVLYNSTKSFLVNFSEALQLELRKTHIHVQALCPGYVATEFHDTAEFAQFSFRAVPRFLWLSSQQVVSESLAALNRGKVICIPRNVYKIIAFLGRNRLTAGLIDKASVYILRKGKS